MILLISASQVARITGITNSLGSRKDI
jgi:hypothetical protein